MTGREWKPGDVAVVASWRGIGQLAFRVASKFIDPDRGSVVWCVLSDDDTRGLSDSEVIWARPVAVIDPEDFEQVARFCAALRHQPLQQNPNPDNVRAAFRELIGSPKPTEPPNVYAVVMDSAGNDWIRLGDGPAPWMLNGSPGNRDTYPWSDVDAVQVISEGIA